MRSEQQATGSDGDEQRHGQDNGRAQRQQDRLVLAGSPDFIRHAPSCRQAEAHGRPVLTLAVGWPPLLLHTPFGRDRLRAVERAYRIAIERNATYREPEPTRSRLSSQHAADREIELE
jgi:hypothetical protein